MGFPLFGREIFLVLGLPGRGDAVAELPGGLMMGLTCNGLTL